MHRVCCFQIIIRNINHHRLYVRIMSTKLIYAYCSLSTQRYECLLSLTPPLPASLSLALI